MPESYRTEFDKWLSTYKPNAAMRKFTCEAYMEDAFNAGRVAERLLQATPAESQKGEDHE